MWRSIARSIAFCGPDAFAYLTDPLADGALETMVAAAQSASNSSNLNQWSVIAVSDPKTKKQLAYLAREDFKGKPARPGEAVGIAHWIAAAPTILLWVVDGSRNYATATAQGTTPEVFDYLDSLLMGAIDTALAAQNAVIAAQSLGIGVTYLGSMRNRAKEVAELIDLPK
jgi:nitroreductase